MNRYKWCIVAFIIAVALILLETACTAGPTASASSPASAPTMTFRGGTLATPSLTITAKVPRDYDLRRGVNLSKAIILTYDDCPRSIAGFKKSVNYATAHDIGLVLFPTGDCVKSYTRRGFDLVSYARQRGIWVGNHSVSHPDLTELSRAAIAREIGASVKSDVGRPPYGAINAKVRKVYDKLSIRPWLWTVDTNDWRGKTRAQVVAWTVKYARGGGTVLMHMQWNGFNPTAMRDIKRGLAAKGRQLCGVWRGEDRSGPIEPTSAQFPDNIC